MKNSIISVFFLLLVCFIYSQELQEDKGEVLAIGRSLINYDPAIFTEIDNHALAAPESVQGSVKDLAEYLLEPAKTDLEKVRSIFRWITDNVAYDTNAYFPEDTGISVQKVFSVRGNPYAAVILLYFSPYVLLQK